MLVTWKYRQRDTFVQRLDPRARLLFLACVILAITIPQMWDIRLLLPLFLLVLTYYALARIEWRDVRRAWIFILLFVTFIIGLNALISGRGGPLEVLQEQSAVILQLPTIRLPFTQWSFTPQITIAKAWFAVTQMVRVLTMATPAIMIPYTIDPSLYGVIFRRMRLPDKAAYSIDLAFRFVPTFGRDFMTTLDAQRARGYEVDKLRGGLFERIRRLAPLVVPVTMLGIVSGEDVVDAMDLRAFGTHPRTWINWDTLRFELRDYLFMGLGLAILVLFIWLGSQGIGVFWIPPWFEALAG